MFRGLPYLTSTRDLTSEPCPLDIFLTRAHGLPLPYLSVPSLSFLIHISPRAYLTMLRASAVVASVPDNPFLPKLDIPFSLIRSHTGRHPRSAGVTTVNLVLTSSGDPALSGEESPVGIEALAIRPTFPLVPSGEQKDVYFPTVTGQNKGTYGYVVDFTDGGKYPGVVMSQSRMKEIEMVLNPFGGMASENHVSIMATDAAPTWVDILVSNLINVLGHMY